MGCISLWDFVDKTFKIQLDQDDKMGVRENTMHATPKLTKRIQEIANAAYDDRGRMRNGYDEHESGRGLSVSCLSKTVSLSSSPDSPSMPCTIEKNGIPIANSPKA